MESIVRDIRLTLRGLTRNPGFTAMAVLTLAIGIGATTTTFSAVYGVLLRPLPFPSADRLARIVQAMPALRAALPVIAAHHERQDGSGYPGNLEGDAIPRIARAFQVVDAYEALTCGRSYRARRSHGDAIAEIVASSGRQHDPEAVRALAALGEQSLTR